MRRLFIFVFLSVLFFNWIGYQFYTTLADQSASQHFNTKFDLADILNPPATANNLPDFHIALVYRDFDFDDLWEFGESHSRSANEIYFSFPNGLLTDPATKENHRTSFKCFNGEYYSTTDQLLTYPEMIGAGTLHDNYLMKFYSVYLSPKDHPPQLFSYC